MLACFKEQYQNSDSFPLDLVAWKFLVSLAIVVTMKRWEQKMDN